jgi:threonine dehydratase
MFSLPELERARTVVARSMAPTAQYCWPALCEATGAELWLKHENHTPIGAFKVRGGLVYLEELAANNALPVGMITATRGNHGQSIPFAARRHGVPVTVLVPEGNSREKNAAMRAWGATVETFGRDFDAAREEAGRRAVVCGLTFAPSFHEHLVRGVATWAYELFGAVRDLDALYVPIGMGSGICGAMRVRDLLGLPTAIVGVVSARADAVARSVEQGRIVETATADTFADGMACRVPNADAIAMIRGGADRVVRVGDDAVAEAMRLIYRATHNVAEGAGAAALAGVLGDRERVRGKRVAAVLSGGNVDATVFADVLRGTTPVCGE